LHLRYLSTPLYHGIFQGTAGVLGNRTAATVTVSRHRVPAGGFTVVYEQIVVADVR
jgi:hypothetical protein